MDNGNIPAAVGRHYRWPWFLLAAVVLGFVLALLWLRPVVRRVQEQREANPPPASAEPTSTNMGH